MAQTDGIAAELGKLENLKQQGLITQQEFDQLKTRLISDHVGQSHTPPEAEEQPGGVKKLWQAIEAADKAPKTPLQKFFTILEGTIAIGAVLAAASAFAYPMVNEGASNNCSALELSLLRQSRSQNQNGVNNDEAVLATLATALAQRVSNGAVAAAWVKTKFPTWPAPISCAVVYDTLAFNPSLLSSFLSDEDIQRPSAAPPPALPAAEPVAPEAPSASSVSVPQPNFSAEDIRKAFVESSLPGTIDDLPVTPSKLVRLDGDTAVLFSEASDSSGNACNSCYGKLVILYLKTENGNFSPLDPPIQRAIDGGAFGHPPDWSLKEAAGGLVLSTTEDFQLEGGQMQCVLGVYNLTNAGIHTDVEAEKLEKQTQSSDCNIREEKP